MYQKQRCRFGKFDLAGQAGLQVLELPYQGDELSMIVLLPNQTDGLSALEKTAHRGKPCSNGPSISSSPR